MSPVSTGSPRTCSSSPRSSRCGYLPAHARRRPCAVTARSCSLSSSPKRSSGTRSTSPASLCCWSVCTSSGRCACGSRCCASRSACAGPWRHQEPRLSRSRNGFSLQPDSIAHVSAPTISPAEVDQPIDETHVTPDRPWVVIVWNDPINLMDYVTFVFQKLFGYGLEKATKLMLDVHEKGKAVVSSGPRERAELDVFRLHEHGLWATMQHDE